VVAKKFDIDSLSQTLKAGDIVVSQLPANQHVDIAKLCLNKKMSFCN
jgi:saccharopine dehydrogenase (NADP+, L-glutamate forming)